jgi:sugar/nucleoside kinase (ribokinase family)
VRGVSVLGDLNLDVILAGMEGPPTLGEEIPAGASLLKAGGSAANVAVMLRGLGVPVRLYAQIGRDAAGDLVLADLRRSGLSTATVSRSADLATGVTVSLSYPGDRMYVSHLGSVSATRLEQLEEGYLRRGRHLHLSSCFLQAGIRPSLPRLLAQARAAGMSVSLDPGHDPEGRWFGGELEAVLSLVDWFLPSAAEARAMTGAAGAGEAARLLGAAERVVVVKAGAEGAWLCQGGAPRRFPAARAAVVDTTCAGDCFDAGFLYALLAGRDVEEAVTAGNRLGALAASCLGLPAREALRGALGRWAGKSC